jgi:hypothetical protein
MSGIRQAKASSYAYSKATGSYNAGLFSEKLNDSDMNLVVNMLFITALLLFARDCSREKPAVAGTPECVEAKIAEIIAERVWDPPAKVYRYLYKGQVVYFIPERCCDIPSQLYDADCNLVCAPDGGYTGKGDEQCPDFFATRQAGELVWEDQR